MTWLAPWALAGGALGMLGVIAAHLLARQRPRALAFATARFLPSGMLEATTVQRVPTDRWWLLLRLLIIALLALGVAQPVLTGSRIPTRTVLLLDRTLSADVQRDAIATLSATDAVIAYDTAATLSPPGASAPTVSRHATLSAALARLVRARDSLATGAEQVRVVIASRFASASLDPSTPTIRAMLPDSIGVLPVRATTDSAIARGAIVVRADADDAIAATALLLGDRVAATGTIIERHAVLTAADSAAARRGATVIHWPTRNMTGSPSSAALTVGRTTWVAPLARDTMSAPTSGQAIAWWADGAPAAWATTADSGCIVEVRAALPTAGDQTLSLGAQSWLASLVTACDRAETRVLVPPAWLAASGVQRSTLVSEEPRTSRVAPWLLGAALALGIAEVFLRLRRAP